MSKKSATLRHQEGPTCGLCDAKLYSAHEQLVDWFNAAKKKWQNLHISWAFRGMQDQQSAFDSGASKVVWPDSAHNNMVGTRPYSLALDVFLIDEDGMARFSYQFNRSLWRWTQEEYGARGWVWGGNFKSINDSGHFQMSSPAKG